MSVLVTGAAGFIGSRLTERLLVQGNDVVGLDNFDGFYDRSIKERNLTLARDSDRFQLVEADIRDASALATLPDPIDTVIHLAALAGVRPSIERPAEYTSVNVDGTVSLLELARERGIQRFVFGSSSSVYGNNDKVPFSESDPVDHPISPYAATKKAGELTCHSYHHLNGMGIVCLRLFTVYGPRQRPDLAIHKFTRLIREGRRIPMFGDGTTQRDYTYIEDILRGIEGTLRFLDEHPGRYEVINLGESQTISLREMIDTVAGALGVRPEIERLPMQPGDVVRTFADVSKARALLGYDPCTSFADGVAEFIEWFESEGER
jgi:UDP-glucuronate 4-epimerase